MRKILLASAAILGASTGAWAAESGFSVAPSQGMQAAPWASGPAANNNNNASGKAVPGANMIPAPGTVVIRLNGRVQTDVTLGWDTGDRTAAGFKNQPIGMSSYMRLYPGVDGMAANGLRYGASIELRENFAAANAAGPAANNTSATAPNPSTWSSSQTVFVRRAFTYLGSDQVGILRMGMTDGVIGLFDGGIFTSATWDGGVGNFNGGTAQVSGATAGSNIPFVWLSQAGAEYSNNKIVYLTPQFFGFDFGLQYAPNMSNGNAGNCNSAGAGCANLSAGIDATRWINQVGVGARYQGSFSGVDLKAFAFYETAGKESIAGGGAQATTGGSIQNFRYDNLSFFNSGVAVSYAGFTVAADYIGGALNGQLNMRPSGGASMNAVVTGITYSNGPWVFGLETAWVDSQGDARLTRVSQRHEWEIAFGGTYKLAPGISLVGEYMYTQRHQGGFDFVANGLGATRDAKANKMVFSTVVTW